jgi:hypothetical protein
MFPDGSHAAVNQNDRRDPALSPVDTRMVLLSHKVLSIFVSKEKRIEVRQKAGQGSFHLGLLQRSEILSKHVRRPALHNHRHNRGLLASPDLTSIRERDACPQGKVGNGGGP